MSKSIFAKVAAVACSVAALGALGIAASAQTNDPIDESKLTPEQDSYYLQVMLRIDQKLLEAANY